MSILNTIIHLVLPQMLQVIETYLTSLYAISIYTTLAARTVINKSTNYMVYVHKSTKNELTHLQKDQDIKKRILIEGYL